MKNELVKDIVRVQELKRKELSGEVSYVHHLNNMINDLESIINDSSECTMEDLLIKLAEINCSYRDHDILQIRKLYLLKLENKLGSKQ